jgi:hypothetical protein
MLETVLLAVTGAALVALILWDAFETVLVPRRVGRRVRLTSVFYVIAWRAWRALARGIRVQGRREAMLATFAPLSILLLLACWAGGLIVGFALLQAAAGTLHGAGSWSGLLYLSGETFFTLGYGDILPRTSVGRWLSVLEAGMGFGFLGTVVGYLPTMYNAFSSRELEISMLDARAGSPPTTAECFHRMPLGRGEAWMEERLRGWERWSAGILESTISYPLLAYYRSQHGNQSWLGTLTVALDTSALILAGADGMPREQAQLTFAMARHALVDVTQIFLGGPPVHGLPDRLTPDDLAHLRERLAHSMVRIPDTPEFVDRLASLRRKYEPYAQALAAHLVITLPPWIHAEPRRDNWQSGPWDRALDSGRPAPAVVWDEEHY